MSEDSDKTNQDQVTEETNTTASTSLAPPLFPLPGDLLDKDYFLSQYIHSLIKAGSDAGDRSEWFGRVIGYSPAAQKYIFRLNGVDYSMEHIKNMIHNKDLVFSFIRVDPITAANYVAVANGIQATVSATFELTDNRLPAAPKTVHTFTFTHLIKPTFQAFSTIIE